MGRNCSWSLWVVVVALSQDGSGNFRGLELADDHRAGGDASAELAGRSSLKSREHRIKRW